MNNGLLNSYSNSNNASANRFQLSFNRNEIEKFRTYEKELMKVFNTDKRCDVYKKAVTMAYDLYVKRV